MALFQIVVGTYEKVLYGWVAKKRGKSSTVPKVHDDSDEEIIDALRDDCTLNASCSVEILFVVLEPRHALAPFTVLSLFIVRFCIYMERNFELILCELVSLSYRLEISRGPKSTPKLHPA